MLRGSLSQILRSSSLAEQFQDRCAAVCDLHNPWHYSLEKKLVLLSPEAVFAAHAGGKLVCGGNLAAWVFRVLQRDLCKLLLPSRPAACCWRSSMSRWSKSQCPCSGGSPRATRTVPPEQILRYAEVKRRSQVPTQWKAWSGPVSARDIKTGHSIQLHIYIYGQKYFWPGPWV